MFSRVRRWWKDTRYADIKAEWAWAKPELLTEEELERLRRFNRQSREVKAAWADSRGKAAAHAVWEELRALLPEEPSPKLEMEMTAAWMQFVTVRHGLAWGLIATDDEYRMEAHAFYLQWMRTRGMEV